MLGSIPYAKMRKTSFKLGVDLWLKDILVFVRKEKLLHVFISVVQLVQFNLLWLLKWTFCNSNVIEGLRKKLVEQLL